MICIPIVASTTEGALQEIAGALEKADIIELRIDYIKNPDLPKLLSGRKKPVIVTNRSVQQGGKFTGGKKENLALLKQAIELGADYVDVEFPNQLIEGSRRLQPARTKIIYSYHNFQHTPEVKKIYKEMKKSPADVLKVVTRANKISDNLKLLDLIKLARSEGKQIIAFCMGETGILSRIFSCAYGGFLTYAALAEGKESAPGQISIDEMRNIYRIEKITQKTQVLGVIGNPIAHSMSPLMHNTVLKEMGLDYVYLPFKVEDPGDFVDTARKFSFRGFNVTIPHKREIIEYLDELAEDAARLGAVNTVVKQDGKLKGYNTDWLGAVAALEKVTSSKDKNVVLIGAGGAGRAIAYGLKKKGGNVTVLNREEELLMARRVGDNFGCKYGGLKELDSLEYDILIHATPVGMWPDVVESLVEKKNLRKGKVVMDIVYNPLQTKLLKDAEECGCRTIDGLKMLAGQAEASFRFWTGKEPPSGLMEEVARKRLSTTNLHE